MAWPERRLQHRIECGTRGMRRLASHFPLKICITPAGALQGFGTDSPLMTPLRVLLLRKPHLGDGACVNSGSLRRGLTVQEMYWEKHL